MRSYRAIGCAILLMSVGVAWGGAGLPKREDMPKYMSLLKSPNPKDRAMAAEMLGRRGQVNFKDVENAVEPLKQTLQNDKDAGARKAAALALGNIHPEAATAVPLLIEKTKSDAVLDVRVAAAESLGVFGTEAKEGASAIRELMQKFDAKKDRNTRKVLQAALMNVTGAQKKK